MLIYLLYDYEEHGPENLLAEVSRDRFRERALEWMRDTYFSPEYFQCHGITRESIIANLDKAIATGTGKYALVRGWGAATVIVIETGEQMRD